MQVVIDNVAQNPSSAYTVSSNTITFTSAPLSGTNNIYVYYTSPITQVIAPGQGTVTATSMASSTGTGAVVLATSPTITTPTIDTITSSASTALTLKSAGTTAITVDTSQNVGIGTSSPTNKLHVVGTAKIEGSTLDLNDAGTFTISQNTTSSALVLRTAASSYMRFDTNGSSERMRIDSSGNFLVGVTSGNADARTTISQGSTDSSPCVDFYKGSGTTTTSQIFLRFFVSAGAGGNGTVNANGAAAVAFGAFSDGRLKENITDLPSQLANIMALRPVEFDYVESMGGGHQIGFIAQDVQAIYPDLVGESSDGMLTLTDMNKNDARLIKAIQELKAINDTQAETINALTARIVALESK